jgi:hypothetical protein
VAARAARSAADRGCRACLVAAECTRCLAPWPFAEDEYCAARRRLGRQSVADVFAMLGQAS